MNSKVFPKENGKKLKEVIQELKAEIRSLKKKNKFLIDELNNVQKPVRPRTTKSISTEESLSDFRKDFVKKFRASLEKRNEES